MPSIDLAIIDHVLFAALVVLVPWLGRRGFRALTSAVEAGDPNARTRAYRRTIISKSYLTVWLAAIWITLDRSAESIGLVAEYTDFSIRLVAGWAFTAVAVGALLLYNRSVATGGGPRASTREAVAHVRALLPRTATEARWFDSVSIAAAISEELIFRGFLFAYLIALIPGAPIGFVIVGAGLIFGLGHTYQGPAGIAKTGTFGVMFGVLYWSTGSVLAPMILHAAIDLIVGRIGRRVVIEAGREDMAAPAAA